MQKVLRAHSATLDPPKRKKLSKKTSKTDLKKKKKKKSSSSGSRRESKGSPKKEREGRDPKESGGSSEKEPETETDESDKEKENGSKEEMKKVFMKMANSVGDVKTTLSADEEKAEKQKKPKPVRAKSVGYAKSKAFLKELRSIGDDHSITDKAELLCDLKGVRMNFLL